MHCNFSPHEDHIEGIYWTESLQAFPLRSAPFGSVRLPRQIPGSTHTHNLLRQAAEPKGQLSLVINTLPKDMPQSP